MTRAGDRPEPPDDLADLPLRPEPERLPERSQNLSLFTDEGVVADPSDERSAAEEPAPTQLGLAEEERAAAVDLETPGDGDEHATASAPAEGDRRPAFSQFVLAGIADLVVHAGVLSLAVLAVALMGMRPSLDQWPGFAAFAALFSFLYTTIPLAFWGQSPGMAWSGLRARDADDRPLTFGQTALRWLASLASVALLGVPLLIAISGRSLADRVSGSATIRVEPPVA